MLDIGCAGGYMGAYLTKQKQCRVDGIDAFPIVQPGIRERSIFTTSTPGCRALDFEKYNYVLMLDVIEHLAKPELFLEQLRSALSLNPSTEVMLSTANIGFLVTRLMLLIGQFNYGRRGILDLTHTRLFTFGSFERAVKQAGFDIVETSGRARAGAARYRRQLPQPDASENQSASDTRFRAACSPIRYSCGSSPSRRSNFC